MGMASWLLRSLVHPRCSKWCAGSGLTLAAGLEVEKREAGHEALMAINHWRHVGPTALAWQRLKINGEFL